MSFDLAGSDLVPAAALLGAGLALSPGAIGPGIGERFTAAKACEGIARAPEHANLLTRTMLVGQAVSEATGIYALVVALLFIFVVWPASQGRGLGDSYAGAASPARGIARKNPLRLLKAV